MNEYEQAAEKIAEEQGTGVVAGTITCPSGLAGRIRPLRGKDLADLTDEHLVETGQQIEELLRRCWVETTDMGPYNGDSVDWSKVLLSDRYFVILKVRIATFGPDFRFEFKCPGCRKVSAWKTDLTTLPVRPMAPADLEAFVAGNAITETMPDGRQFVFRLPIGADEPIGARIVAAHNGQVNKAILPLVKTKIVEIAGVKSTRIGQYLDEGPVDLAFKIQRIMDKHYAGVDAKVHLDCQIDTCRQEVRKTIPFVATMVGQLAGEDEMPRI